MPPADGTCAGTADADASLRPSGRFSAKRGRRPDHAGEREPCAHPLFPGALHRAAAHLQPTGAVGRGGYPRLMRGEGSQGVSAAVPPGTIRLQRRQHIRHPSVPQHGKVLLRPRDAQVTRFPVDGCRRPPHGLTGVIPIDTLRRLREVRGGHVPDPVRPITNDADLGLGSDPASARFGPELPSKRLGIRQHREIALLLSMDRARLRLRTRGARPRGGDTADLQLLPADVVDVRYDAIHAHIHTGGRPAPQVARCGSSAPW